jgi:hypothetical protein
MLVTGSVVRADNSLYLVAKIIGTETSRVLGASVKGTARDDLGNLADGLATEAHAHLGDRGGSRRRQQHDGHDGQGVAPAEWSGVGEQAGAGRNHGSRHGKPRSSTEGATATMPRADGSVGPCPAANPFPGLKTGFSPPSPNRLF